MEKILKKLKSGFGVVACFVLPFVGGVALAADQSFPSGTYIDTGSTVPDGTTVTVSVSCTDENGAQAAAPFILPLIVGTHDGQANALPWVYEWDDSFGLGGGDGVAIDCDAVLTGVTSNGGNQYTDSAGNTYELLDNRSGGSRTTTDQDISYGIASNAANNSNGDFFFVKITAPVNYTFTVKKFVTAPDYDKRFGALAAIDFNLKVICADGSEHAFTLKDGGSDTFTIPATQSNMDCKISEDLGAMAGYFKVLSGDTFGPNNGRMKGVVGTAAASSGKVCGDAVTSPATFCVRNTYAPDQTHAFNVSKTASSDADTEPFQIEISCKNGDAYSFGLEPGEMGTFFYPRGEAMDCEVSEPSIEEGADTTFTVKKGDTFSAHNGRMLGASNQAAASSGSACGETYSEATFCVRNIKAQDSDGDGLSDAEEVALGTNPNQRDSDGDGLSDGIEVDGYGTNPLVCDTDGDGRCDGAEVDAMLASGSEKSGSNNPLVNPANIPVFGPVGVLAVLMGLMWFGRRRLR